MKKFLCIVLSAMLALNVLTIIGFSAVELRLGELNFFADEECTIPVTQLQSGRVYARYSLTSNQDTRINNAAVALSVYKNSALADVDLVQKAINPYQNVFFNTSVTIPENLDGVTVKALVWEMEDNIEPILSVKTLPVLSYDNTVKSFSLAESTGLINPLTNNISVTIPSYADITALVPQISLPAGASVTPEADAVQNFSSPVAYQVTAQNGEVRTYTVSVTKAAPVFVQDFEESQYNEMPVSENGISWSGSNIDGSNTYVKVADDPKNSGRGQVLHIYDNSTTDRINAGAVLNTPIKGDVRLDIDVLFEHTTDESIPDGINLSYNWIYMGSGVNLIKNNAVGVIGTGADSGNSTIVAKYGTASNEPDSALAFTVGSWHTVSIIYYKVANVVTYYIDNSLVAWSVARVTNSNYDTTVDGINQLGFMTTDGRRVNMYVDNISLTPYTTSGIVLDFESYDVGVQPSDWSITTNSSGTATVEAENGNQYLLLNDIASDVDPVIARYSKLERLSPPFEMNYRVKYLNGLADNVTDKSISYMWSGARGVKSGSTFEVAKVSVNGGNSNWRYVHQSTEADLVNGYNVEKWNDIRMVFFDDNTVAHYINGLYTKTSIAREFDYISEFFAQTTKLRTQRLLIDDVVVRSYSPSVDFVESFDGGEQAFLTNWMVLGGESGSASIVQEGQNNVLRIEDTSTSGSITLLRNFPTVSGSFEFSYRYKTNRDEYVSGSSDAGYNWVTLRQATLPFADGGTYFGGICPIDSGTGLTWAYRVNSGGTSVSMDGTVTPIDNWETLKVIYRVDKENRESYIADYYLNDKLIANGIRIDDVTPNRIYIRTSAPRTSTIYIDDITIKSIDD